MMFSLASWCLAFLGVQASPVPLQEPAQRLEALAREALQEQQLVGLAVGVVEEGALAHTLFLGLADREAGVRVGEGTLFRWASISKPLTAVAAVQLVEAGRLDLARDVRELVPEFPAKPWPIDARQLLCHQAGIVHYANGPVVRTQREYDVEHPFVCVVTALDHFAESPLLFEPGTRFAYTTHGYMLLGALVERAGGEPFARQVATRIAEPLGLTTLRPDYAWETLPGRAVGYRKLGRLVVRSSDTDVSWKLAGGGFLSSVGDLGSFAAALCREDLLPRSALDRMWTVQRTRDGAPTGYGLGFSVSRSGGRLRVSHSGAQEKTRTLMQILPDEGRALVLMTNSEWANLAPVADLLWAELEALRSEASEPERER